MSIELYQRLKAIENIGLQQVRTRTDLSERTELPDTIWRALADHDLIGIAIPQKFGGSDLPLNEQIRLAEAFTRSSRQIGVATIWQSQVRIGGYLLPKFGNTQQKQVIHPHHPHPSCTSNLALHNREYAH